VSAGLAHRTPIVLEHNTQRVLLHLFIAGQEDFGSPHSRANVVLERALALSDADVHTALIEVLEKFHHRHPDLAYWLNLHATTIINLMPESTEISQERRQLIGAIFTHEFSTEGASLTNPSMVISGPITNGSAPFVMSVRSIGEGHRSSIGFRTGQISQTGEVEVDTPETNIQVGLYSESKLHKRSFLDLLEKSNDLGDNASLILNNVGEEFCIAELETQISRLLNDRGSFRNADLTALRFRSIAERSYTVTFTSQCAVSERILWPRSAAEWHGMEDLRLVKFARDDNQPIYFGTYTAFDGVVVNQQMMHTLDFKTFNIFPVTGSSAQGKGIALFPRLIDGKYAALSRCDGETNSISFSDSPDRWNINYELHTPKRFREVVQVGNCGSPIETDEGWLVITHSVGPMRTYTIGAILLDLDDPCHVIGELASPLLVPEDDSRDGYVPNVVYSCGSTVHEGQLIIPFGRNDQSIGIATIPIAQVLSKMESVS
jgi:predicted GH43/DUF377 family glycosyl hydrolase